MNVKQYIDNVTTPLFQKLAASKHADYRQGFEPIPDLVIFNANVHADWRRRNAQNTLQCMLLAIEVKASERAKSRLTASEIITDIQKLDAHRSEVRQIGGDFLPVMMVVDTAPTSDERMTEWSLAQSRDRAAELGVDFMYFDPTTVIWDRT